MLGKDAEKLHYFSVFLRDTGVHLFWGGSGTFVQNMQFSDGVFG